MKDLFDIIMKFRTNNINTRLAYLQQEKIQRFAHDAFLHDMYFVYRNYMELHLGAWREIGNYLRNRYNKDSGIETWIGKNGTVDSLIQYYKDDNPEKHSIDTCHICRVYYDLPYQAIMLERYL